MDTKDRHGAELQGGSEAARREAARQLGQARTERKAAAARENGLKGGAHDFPPETRSKMVAAQAARRERERLEREALGIPARPAATKSAGHPRSTVVETTGEKRGRGRPRKTAEGVQE